jgi:hypothetical protein
MLRVRIRNAETVLRKSSVFFVPAVFTDTILCPLTIKFQNEVKVCFYITTAVYDNYFCSGNCGEYFAFKEIVLIFVNIW